MDLDDEVWPRAVASFSTAGTCYQAAADSLREEARQLPPDLPEDARRQQMVGFQEGIDSGLRQAGRSFLNAALAALKTGDRAGALGYARSATGYAEVKERADSIARSLETR
jgi:hypothetical protein